MARWPSFGVDLRTGFISDDIVRQLGVSVAPLGKPSAGVVRSRHLGNALNATAPADSRVIHYAVYRATRTDDAAARTIADAVFQENVDGLPWTDRYASDNDLLSHRHDYWLVSLDRDYQHYQTVALDAFYVGYA